MSGKMRSTKNNKKSDGKFKKKNIKHDSADESSRAVFNHTEEKQNDHL